MNAIGMSISVNFCYKTFGAKLTEEVLYIFGAASLSVSESFTFWTIKKKKGFPRKKKTIPAIY